MNFGDRPTLAAPASPTKIATKLSREPFHGLFLPFIELFVLSSKFSRLIVEGIRPLRALLKPPHALIFLNSATVLSSDAWQPGVTGGPLAAEIWGTHIELDNKIKWRITFRFIVFCFARDEYGGSLSCITKRIVPNTMRVRPGMTGSSPGLYLAVAAWLQCVM